MAIGEKEGVRCHEDFQSSGEGSNCPAEEAR